MVLVVSKGSCAEGSYVYLYGQIRADLYICRVSESSSLLVVKLRVNSSHIPSNMKDACDVGRGTWLELGLSVLSSGRRLSNAATRVECLRRSSTDESQADVSTYIHWIQTYTLGTPYCLFTPVQTFTCR